MYIYSLFLQICISNNQFILKYLKMSFISDNTNSKSNIISNKNKILTDILPNVVNDNEVLNQNKNQLNTDISNKLESSILDDFNSPNSLLDEDIYNYPIFNNDTTSSVSDCISNNIINSETISLNNESLSLISPSTYIRRSSLRFNSLTPSILSTNIVSHNSSFNSTDFNNNVSSVIAGSLSQFRKKHLHKASFSSTKLILNKKFNTVTNEESPRTESPKLSLSDVLETNNSAKSDSTSKCPAQASNLLDRLPSLSSDHTSLISVKTFHQNLENNSLAYVSDFNFGLDSNSVINSPPKINVDSFLNSIASNSDHFINHSSNLLTSPTARRLSLCSNINSVFSENFTTFSINEERFSDIKDELESPNLISSPSFNLTLEEPKSNSNILDLPNSATTPINHLLNLPNSRYSNEPAPIIFTTSPSFEELTRPKKFNFSNKGEIHTFIVDYVNVLNAKLTVKRGDNFNLLPQNFADSNIPINSPSQLSSFSDNNEFVFFSNKSSSLTDVVLIFLSYYFYIFQSAPYTGTYKIFNLPPKFKLEGKIAIGPKLGDGAFGAVHLGWHVNSKLPIAIKLEKINSDRTLEREYKTYRSIFARGPNKFIPEVYFIHIEECIAMVGMQVLGKSLTKFCKEKVAYPRLALLAIKMV